MARRLTTEEFIKRAMLIHPAYDYSKVDYIASRKKVILICPHHGEFSIMPNTVLSKHAGCLKCGNRLTKEEFIKRALVKHNSFYDYSNVEFINTSIAVDIICPEHGVFKQTPFNHLKYKKACEKCNPRSILSSTTEKFIINAKKVHGEKYNYSKVKYINNSTKVEIICPYHGSFNQAPNRHYNNKQGCPKCSATYKVTYKEFVKKANIVHCNRYVYGLNYISYNKEIDIKCPKHGVFKCKPSNHINQLHGCPKCGREKVAKQLAWTTDDFIKKSKLTHGEKYGYSNSHYVNYNTPVVITCPRHGDFLQKPGNHFNRESGCPKCSMSKGEQKLSRLLEENSIDFVSQKTFDECKNKRVLPFDFYLPDYDILIEYDGEQHYKPIDHFGGIESFNQIQSNDIIKNEFCENNSIRLYRIKYNDNLEKAFFNIKKDLF